MDLFSGLLFVAFGAALAVWARPIAAATINSYPRLSEEKRARYIPAQATANRIGGIIAVVLGLLGLFGVFK